MELAEVVASLDDRRERKAELRESASITTGSLGLDLALGGGYRKGRIVELSGDYSTYKTFFALHTVAQAQKTGPVLWLDSASDFNPEHARLAGVKLDHLAVDYPRDAGHAMYIMRTCASNFALMVLDSASGLHWDEQEYASMPAWFQWLKTEMQPHTVALFISNERATSDQAFTRELRKWSSQQVRLYPEGPKRVNAVVTKNHLVVPHTHHIRLRFLPDFDAEYELIRLGLDVGVLHKNGSWITTGSTNLGAGVDGAVRALVDAPGLAAGIRRDIQNALR